MELLEIRPGRKCYVNVLLNVNTSAPVAFFIHGAGGRSEQYSEILPLFESKYTIVLFDFLGHGNSDKPLTSFNLYSTSELLHDIEEIFNKYKANSGNIIVAHSYGTALATKLYNNQNEIEKIILIGACVNKPPGSSHFIWYLPAFILEYIRFVFRTPFRQRAFHPNTLQNNLQLILAEEAKSSKNPMFLMKSLCLGMIWATRDEFRNIQAPCLLIGGERDGITPVAELEELKNLIPNAVLEIIPSSGHIPMLENPDAVKQVITKFLEL